MAEMDATMIDLSDSNSINIDSLKRDTAEVKLVKLRALKNNLIGS